MRPPEDTVLGPEPGSKTSIRYRTVCIFLPEEGLENNENLEKCAPRRTPFWAPSQGAKQAVCTGLFAFFDPKRVLKMTKSLKKRVSRGLRFGAQNEAQNLCFSLQKTRFSEQTTFQKRNLKRTKILKNVPPEGNRFGLQNGPQNESKRNSKLDPFLEPILIQFWGLFWGFFGCHLGSKTGPGEV